MHPTFEQILGASDDHGPVGNAVRVHLVECATCRALAEAMLPIETPPALAEPPLLLVVTRDSYVDWREIGVGGMGRTSVARDRRLGRAVAIKELRDVGEFEEPELRHRVRARFEREARLAARLQHPAIVPVYEAGQWPDGEPFYAMQYVEGTTLEHEIARRSTLGERLELLTGFIAIVEATAYAHSCWIVHRDVNPRNILVGRFGETFLIDWGLAKELDRGGDEFEPVTTKIAPADNLTHLGAGTANYMPPEQARGEPPDERFDVYALGSTLYHLLAGVPPYASLAPGSVRRRLAVEAPPALTELAPDVPPALQTIVAKAMAREPSDRFPTANDLADELRRFHTGQLTLGHPHTAGEIVRHWLRRHRAVVRVSAIALVVIAIVVIGSLRRALHERDAAVELSLRVEAEERRATAGEQHAQEALADERGVLASSLAVQPMRQLDALSAAILAVAPAMLAHRAPSALASAGLLAATETASPVRVYPGVAGTQRIVRVAPNGEAVIIVRTDGALAAWDIRTGERRELRSSLAKVMDLAVSPDARSIAVHGLESTAEVFDIATGARTTLTGHTGPVSEIAFAHDSATLVTASYDGTVIRWDRATGQRLATFDAHERVTVVLPDATGRVFVAGVSGRSFLWHRDGTAVPLAEHTAEISGAAFTADGEHLLTRAGDGRVLLWEHLDDAPVFRILFEHLEIPGQLAISPRGEVAMDVTEHRIALFDLVATELRNQRAVAGEMIRAAPVGSWQPFSGDGARFLAPTLDGTLHLYDAQSAVELASMTGFHTITAWRSTFVEHDALVAGATDDGRMMLWEVRPGLAPGVVGAHASEITALRPSPDGTRLLTAAADGSVQILDLHNGRRLAYAKTPTELLTATWSSDGASVAVAGVDGIVRILAIDGAVEATFSGHRAPVVALDARDGHFVTASLDGTARIWSRSTGVVVLNAGPAALADARFTPDGTRVVTGGADGLARLWDARTGAPLGALETADHSAIVSTCFAPDGETLAVGTFAGQTELWHGDARIATIEARAPEATCCPFSPDGSTLVTAAGDGHVVISDARGRAIHTLVGHGLHVGSARFATDNRLVTTSLDHTLHVWELAQGTLERSIPADASDAMITADGEWLVLAERDGGVRVIPATLAVARREACAMAVRLEPSAELVAACADQSARTRSP